MSDGDERDRNAVRIDEHFADGISREIEQMTLNRIKIKAKMNIDIARLTIIEYLLFVEDLSTSNSKDFAEQEEEY